MVQKIYIEKSFFSNLRPPANSFLYIKIYGLYCKMLFNDKKIFVCIIWDRTSITLF